MRSKLRDMIAAWAVALLLMAVIAGAPWETLHTGVPPGVVDPGQQRFAVESAAGEPGHAPHQEDSRFTAFGPEGL